MAITKVKHQADKNCKDCEFFDLDIYQDSFGPVIEVNCEKGHYGHVDYYAEACKAYKDSDRPRVNEACEVKNIMEQL